MRFKFLLLFAALLMSFSLLFIRLLDVQIRNGKNYFAQAEENRYFNKKDPAERAIFLDRYGEPLVINQKQYFKYLDKDRLYSDRQFLDRDEALSLIATDSASVSYEFNRLYPYKEALASVLGYLSPATAEDLERNFDLPISSRIGRLGLEQFFDRNLQSKASERKYEANALGQKQRLVASADPIYGQNIQTSIDPYLSKIAYQAMDGQKGAVIIMDASNGELLTLISTPSFDPNVFENNFINSLYKRDSSESLGQIRNYLNDEDKVFFNRSIAGSYPPGSVFKLITALAALEEGAINENTIVDDEGTLKVGDFEYANWYYTQYGRVEGEISVQRALARSNDIFFYKAAEWVGPTKLAEYARRFGLGSKTGLQIFGEASGLVPDPDWKQSQRGESWYLGNTYHFGIGQGDLLVTPIQIASLTQAIANHGTLCQASFLPVTQQNCRDLAVSESNLDLILSGMLGACSSGGTAYPLFPYNSEISLLLGESNELSAMEKIKQGMIACKTGTAEFGAADERGYRKTHAWTTAVVGIDKNRLLVGSALENSVLETQVATAAGEFNSDKQKWQKLIKEADFPSELVITVLVESDEGKIFREGSEDASPVIAKILTWLFD